MLRALGFSGVLLVAVCVLPFRAAPVHAASDGLLPGNPYLKVLLADARHKWRRDAIIVRVDLKGIPNVAAWLGVGLYSPSNGATLGVDVGGPNNGAVMPGRANPSVGKAAPPVALPTTVNVDLPDAVALIGKAGLNGPLGPTYLSMVGASGTQPILAWTVHVSAGPWSPPFFVNAQTGKFIPWQRAMDPPDGTDAQLRQIWNTFFHRNDPPPGTGIDSPAYKAMECVAAIQEGSVGCP